MWQPHFHLCSGDSPFPPLQVELGPFCVAEFGGTDKYQWGELKRRDGDRLSFVSVYCAQQCADSRRIGHGRTMLDRRCS